MTEATNGHKKFVFDEFRLVDESRTLWRGGEEIHLAKRPFDVLQFLIENRERVVSREELLDKFWDGHDVYDDALRKTVGTIRPALDDMKKPPRFIETRYGSGFRFIGTVEEEEKRRRGEEEIEISDFKFQISNHTHNGQQTKDKGQKTKNEIANRKVLLSIFAVAFILLVAFGFYVNFPNGKENSSNNPADSAVRSIAVLPLKNLTGEANNEYFSDGVTESIITELSRVSELKIVSRSSTFALKDKEIDPREIGKKLNVDALLEGSLQKKGDLLSVSVRLISTRDGSVLWTSQDFERPFSNAYELQDTISQKIAIELRTELSDVSPNRKTTNADAYQAYLKGRFHWNKRTAEGIKKSIEFYEQAIGFDSNYAPAYAGLAESYLQGIWHVPFSGKEVLPKAKAAAIKAVELDKTSAEAHAALGNVYELEWNWAQAEREMQRAIELNPRYARAHHILAFHFYNLKRYDEALASIERARELDPLNLVINTDKGNLLFGANRPDEAFEQWKKTLELDPNFAMIYENRAIVYKILGNETAAIEESSKAMELNGQTPEKINDYRQTAVQYGIKEIYRQELKDLFAKEKRGEKISFVSAAWFHTLLGEKDEAFKYLEKAYREHSAEMVLLPSYMFSSLRGDSRYADLLRRAGLPE